ncbi:hypothetical protein BC828DRAFT_419260, partial [Blastocladiella britannica]
MRKDSIGVAFAACVGPAPRCALWAPGSPDGPVSERDYEYLTNIIGGIYCMVRMHLAGVSLAEQGEKVQQVFVRIVAYMYFEVVSQEVKDLVWQTWHPLIFGEVAAATEVDTTVRVEGSLSARRAARLAELAAGAAEGEQIMSAVAPTSAIVKVLQRITSQKIGQFAATKKRIDAQYEGIEAAADAAPTKAEEVRVLVDGMRKVAVAQSPAHPDAAALKKHAVPALVADPTARPDLATFWARKLRHEMAQGRRRTELALLYGKVLSEHSSSVAEDYDASNIKDWDAVRHGETHADAVASAA